MTLIGSSTCSPCNMLKRVLSNQGVDYKYIDLHTKEGAKCIDDYDIRTVPTMIDDEGQITAGAPNILATIQ